MDQGPDILRAIREGFEGWMIPREEGIINQNAPIIGVSEGWNKNDRDGLIGWIDKPIKDFTYIDGKEPKELYSILRNFLEEGRLKQYVAPRF